jgi:hypothetical protein
MIRKLLSKGLRGESPPVRFRGRVDNLQMAQLVKEDIVEKETPHG